MKNWILAFLLVSVALMACDKRVTPNKVEKKIVNREWIVTSFTFQGNQLDTSYTGNHFVFTEDGAIEVYDVLAATGSWSLGSEKKPTILYMNFPGIYPFTNLAGDWQVDYIGDNRMNLTLNSTEITAKLTMYEK